MFNIKCRIIDSFNNELLELIKGLEIENLGKEAAINQWQIPVIIRYGRLLVAENDDGKIIGVCEVIRDWQEKKKAFIQSFYIIEKYRGKGIGRELLSFTLELLNREDFTGVELTVDPKNLTARKLYKDFGFKVTGIRENEYGTGNDRLLMSLDLI